MRRARLVAATSLMAAVVFLVTASFSVYIPETRGYFNLGEAAVYAASIVLPPAGAALAGGLGSMLADVALGYYHYAAATLVVKGCEALVASSLLRRRPRAAASRALDAVAAVSVPLLMAAIGALFYTGRAEALLALPATAYTASLAWDVSALAWISVALALAAYSGYASLRGWAAGWTLLSLIAGGCAMVAGYFLYEQLVLGVAAVAEVPFNVMQVLVGASVALLAERRLRQLALDTTLRRAG